MPEAIPAPLIDYVKCDGQKQVWQRRAVQGRNESGDVCRWGEVLI